MKYYDELIETMPRKELNKLQLKRLQDLVSRMYNDCKPYRAKMEKAGVKPADIKTLDDLKKLPFTEKHDLREHYPFGMFTSPPTDIVRVHASSGTTGKLTVAGYSQHDIDVWTDVMARSLAASGCIEESIVNVAYGYGMFTGGLGAHYGSERLGATTIPAGSGNTKRQLQLFKDFGVTALCCTPSYALYLADEMKAEGYTIDDFKLKQGIFGAEPWTDQMRLEIEKKLGLKAFDVYGLSEIIGPGVAMECEFQCGLHIWEDHFLPEIINPDTLQPCIPGEQGELVFTTITKTGMPLIRYRTRDITTLIEEPCKCGRTHVRMKKVVGRNDDMLIIRGVNVFPSQIESALLTNEYVEPYYQINIDRINNLDKMEVQLELNETKVKKDGVDFEKLRKKLERTLASALCVTGTLTFVPRGTIKREMGKAVRVFDNRKH